MAADREAIGDLPNPLGLAGIEFIEYRTGRPQALGQVLEMAGFHPVARHRSREVTLYRQGAMNLIVNAHAVPAAETDAAPTIAAVALRVRDAGAAYRRALERGAWGVPVQVEPMELHIPAIHGVGTSRLYFVDRWQEFSIYDVDFVPIPLAQRQPPALAGLHWFGVVQYIGNDRTEDWTEFYRELFGFSALPDQERFGILPKGRVLKSPHVASLLPPEGASASLGAARREAESPCNTFYWQLIEPEPGILDVEDDEMLNRVAFGTPDVLRAVAELRARGIEFVESSGVHSESRGAVTRSMLGGVAFELVHDER